MYMLAHAPLLSAKKPTCVQLTIYERAMCRPKSIQCATFAILLIRNLYNPHCGKIKRLSTRIWDDSIHNKVYKSTTTHPFLPIRQRLDHRLPRALLHEHVRRHPHAKLSVVWIASWVGPHELCLIGINLGLWAVMMRGVVISMLAP